MGLSGCPGVNGWRGPRNRSGVQITCSQANRISPVRCSGLFMRPLAWVEELADERCGANPPERPMFHPRTNKSCPQDPVWPPKMANSKNVLSIYTATYLYGA